MYSQGLQQFTNMPLIVAGMLLFFTVFLIIIFRTIRNATDFQAARNLPLADEVDCDERR